MALTPGTRTSPYEVVALIGTGGMGAALLRLDRAIEV